MVGYLIKRLGIYVVILLGVTVILFGIMMAMPGDPYSYLEVDPNMTEETIEAKRDELGLNDPVYVQYIRWMKNLLHGELGYTSKGQPVSDQVLPALKNSLILTIPSFILSVVLAGVLGVYTALHKNGVIDKIITALTFLEISIPTFFLALFCVKVFCADFGLLPVSGMHSLGKTWGKPGYISDLIRHMILPVSILTLMDTASLLRYTRSSMLEVMNQDYIRTARAKGFAKTQAVLKHGVYNALLPVITVVCMRLPGIFSGALFTETVFVWPGIGTLNYNSILNREYNIIIAVATMSAVVILSANLLADILYAIADPRIRLEGKRKQA